MHYDLWMLHDALDMHEYQGLEVALLVVDLSKENNQLATLAIVL